MKLFVVSHNQVINFCLKLQIYREQSKFYLTTCNIHIQFETIVICMVGFPWSTCDIYMWHLHMMPGCDSIMWYLHMIFTCDTACDTYYLLESIQWICKCPTYRFENTIVWERWHLWRSEINIDCCLILYIKSFCSSPLPIFKLSLQIPWINFNTCDTSRSLWPSREREASSFCEQSEQTWLDQFWLTRKLWNGAVIVNYYWVYAGFVITQK